MAVCIAAMLPMAVTAFIIPAIAPIVTLGVVCTALLCSAVRHGLPLFSYGGLYLCQIMLLFGLLLSARRTGQVESGARPARNGRNARQAHSIR